MLYYLSWFTAWYAPVFVASVSVNIDGVIDLGPNWHYEYKIHPTEDSHLNSDTEFTNTASPLRSKHKKNKRTTKTVTENKDPYLHVTKYGSVEPENIYSVSRSIKEDSKINEFTYHVYKQSLKVFDEIKKKVNPTIEHRVELLARNYDVKFREFINETLDQKIKTRIGSERAVLDIIDTSNRLLKRLVNYFVGDMNRDGILRNNMAAANVFQKVVDRECELEIQHACNKFKICRTSRGFSEFMINVFTIIIKTDDKKIKQAADAVTEVLKNTDFSNIMEPKTKKKFKHMIKVVETYDAILLKAMFKIAKNVFALNNQPINVMVSDTGTKHINKTVALLEIVDELNKRLPENEENVLEWTDIKTSLTDWSKDKRYDILEIMQGLVTFLKKEAIDKLDGPTAMNFNQNLYLIFS